MQVCKFRVHNGYTWATFLCIMSVTSTNKKKFLIYLYFKILCSEQKGLTLNKDLVYYTCNTNHFQIDFWPLKTGLIRFRGSARRIIGHWPQWIGTTRPGRWSPAVSPLSDLNKLSVPPPSPYVDCEPASLARSRLSARALITRHAHITGRATGTWHGRRLVAADNRSRHRRSRIRISSLRPVEYHCGIDSPRR